jgi:hypothetical protein
MKKTFTVGQRVGCALDAGCNFTAKVRYDGNYGEDPGPAFGKVTEVLRNGKVVVLWDDDYLNDHDVRFDEKTGQEKSSTAKGITMDTKLLLPEAEMKAKFSELEKEYEKVAVQIRSKLTEAGKLIKEANKMAKKAGVDSLAAMYDATSPLESAMDACGWRTSSWGC